MTAERAARRYPALAFPGIARVWLTPCDLAATLVNLSATGVLVECASRPQMGSLLTVQFEGTFSPASVQATVVRCEVAGIAADGSLRYHLGMAFNTRITLPNDVENGTDLHAARPDAPSPSAAAAAAPSASRAATAAVRNRW